jgi:hypothetical protein
MHKLLSICPHLSTGGAPQVLVKRIELIQNDLDIYVVEYSNLSDHYIIQKNRLKKLIKPDHFFTLGENKFELLNIIKQISPDYIHFEEMPEFFMDYDLAKSIYTPNRKYKIFETTHSSDYVVENKKFFPDKFLFVSQYNSFKFNKFRIPSEVIEYPVEKRQRPTPEKKLELQKKLGLDPNFKHVINVGLFTRRKNQGYAFEIARKMEDKPVKFHFIGNQAGNFEDYWKPIMKNVPKNVILWGERDDVFDFYDACDLFLFTSRGFRYDKELNPLVIKEALEHQIPQFIFSLDVYNRKYDIENDTIHYLYGDIDVDAGLIRNFLFPTKYFQENNIKNRPKIRAVHLLLEEDNRASESIKEMEKLKNYGIDYIQHINKRYTKIPPKENCERPWDIGRIGAYSLRGPHYGNYTSFRKAILTEFSEDIDFLMILESDCKLTIPIEEFINKVYESCDIIQQQGIQYMSFGDNKNLRTGELVSDIIENTNVPWMYVTNKIIGIQCIMFPKSIKNFVQHSYETMLWDVSDLYFNNVFKYKKKGIAPCLTTQIEGISTIQGENITHFLLKNENTLLKEKNEADIIVEFLDDNKFHIVLSDFFQNEIKEIKVDVVIDDKNIFSSTLNLSPYASNWIQIYEWDKHNIFYFDFTFKNEFLFRKKITLYNIIEKPKNETNEPIIKNVVFEEIINICEDDFKTEFDNDKNTINIYYSNEHVSKYKILIRNITTDEKLYSQDDMIFNKNFYNWIIPSAKNLYKTDNNFNGFKIDFYTGDKLNFSKEIILRTSLKPNINTNDLYVILTYPDTKIKEKITLECIQNIKSNTNKKILLVSHYPVSKEIQKICDYYLYDSYNPLIEHTLYKYYWSELSNIKVELNLDKLYNYNSLNQSLTVLNNIENAIRFAKDIGYKRVICVSYDFIFNNDNINQIDNICNRLELEKKGGYFMSYYEGDMSLLKTVFFIINTDLYTKVFTNPRTPEKYNSECLSINSHNFLENYFRKKLANNLSELIIENTDEEKLFNNSNINIFSGVEYLAVIPVKEQKAFVVWFNSSNKKDNRRIEFTFINESVSETATHFIKDRSYYYKKINFNHNDNWIINVKFIDSDTNNTISETNYNVNKDTFNDLEMNGIFTEKS